MCVYVAHRRRRRAVQFTGIHQQNMSEGSLHTDAADSRLRFQQ